jgi:hypothetical protein
MRPCGSITSAELQLPGQGARLSPMQDEDAPLTVPPTVKGHTTAVWSPRELFGGRVGQDTQHGPIGEIENPCALTEQLKDHLRPVGRNSRGADQPAPDRRLELTRLSSLDIQDHDPIFVRV